MTKKIPSLSPEQQAAAVQFAMENGFTPAPTIRGIHTFRDLSELAAELGVRDNWHEPDEQGVSARIIGTHLDNAMGSTTRGIGDAGEFNVVIMKDAQDVAVINLATLLSWGAALYLDVKTTIDN